MAGEQRGLNWRSHASYFRARRGHVPFDGSYKNPTISIGDGLNLLSPFLPGDISLFVHASSDIEIVIILSVVLNNNVIVKFWNGTIGQYAVHCQLSQRCQPEMKWCLANSIIIIFIVLWSNDRSISNFNYCKLIMDQ